MFTVVIGDIHGCFDQLQNLLNAVKPIVANHEHKFVFLGDYVDRGPDSRKVIDFLMGLDNAVCLKGNHEDMMVKQMPGWLGNGGYSTLFNYQGLDEELAKHIEWLDSLPLYHEDDHRIYVHAGLWPLAPLEEQDAADMLWIRNEFLNSHYDFGKLVVHGHSAVLNNPEIKTNRINLDTACVFGGKLTAAIFNDKQRDPVHIVQVSGLEKRVGDLSA